MSTPPLTRSIGSAERAMRALLETELARTGLSFAQWTALVFTSTASLSPQQIIQRQMAGHIVAMESETQYALDNLVAREILTQKADGSLRQSEQGHMLFLSLSAAIERITNALYGTLPQADLEVTHRTLLEITARASKLLAAK